MIELQKDFPAAWGLLHGLWRDKWLILTCLAIGMVLGFAIALWPKAPRYSTEFSLDMTGRFSSRSDTFNQFSVEWRRSSLWIGDTNMPAWMENANMSALIQYDAGQQAAKIGLFTSDASGQTIARYKQELQALIEKFEASVADSANLQLRELQALREMPGAGANDYIASTSQQMHLAIVDATGDPGLMVLREVTPLTRTESTNRGGSTFTVTAVLGAIMGVLLSIARMIWAAAGRYAQGEQAEAATSPKPARRQSSRS